MAMKVLIILVVLLFGVISMFVHEGIHWIQSTLDTRVEPIGIEFSSDVSFGNIDKIPLGGMVTLSKATTNNNDDIIAWNNENPVREFVAYSIQILFILFSTIIVMRLIYERKK